MCFHNGLLHMQRLGGSVGFPGDNVPHRVEDENYSKEIETQDIRVYT